PVRLAGAIGQREVRRQGPLLEARVGGVLDGLGRQPVGIRKQLAAGFEARDSDDPEEDRQYPRVRAPAFHDRPAFVSPAASAAVLSGASTGSTRTAQYLNSGILAVGSRASLVSRLAAASRKWNGMNTEPRPVRGVILAGA